MRRRSVCVLPSVLAPFVCDKHHTAELTQLAAWLREVNTERPFRATGVIPAVRRAEELPAPPAAEACSGRVSAAAADRGRCGGLCHS